MNLRIKGGRSCFYQWDSGQTVVVEHESTIHEVHFAHKGDKNALTVIPKEIENGVEANVPNILLQSAETLFAYLVFRDADGTETRRSVSFPVIPRPKPDGYVYTETEVLNYAYLDERLRNLEGEGLANAVADYLKENPIEAGATAEEAAQIQQNKEDIEQLSQDKLDAAKLPEAVNDALAQAKASGEFDGKDGTDGQDGYTPVKGVDYFDGADGKDGKDGQDGYTPQKGVDYFDGQDGKDGVDGKDGYTPQKGIDYFDGKDGKDGQNGSDGVSATHSWNGTVLTVTSASGTFSADLKGADGKDGQNGSDYVLTDADKQEIAELAADMVDVPTDDHINDLINTALGVIENGTY